MPTKMSNDTGCHLLMQELLTLAQTEFNNDRRSEKRYPFFRPAFVQVDDHSFSAFTREIGASGMGLLHSMKLPLAGSRDKDCWAARATAPANREVRIDWRGLVHQRR